MGYERDHTIVVSGWKAEDVTKAHEQAVKIFFKHDSDGLVSPIVPRLTNGGASFFIGPDGSKEGWTTSDNGDAARAEFIKWLDKQRHEDLSSNLNWVEVQFGDDDWDTHVVTDSDAARRGA